MMEVKRDGAEAEIRENRSAEALDPETTEYESEEDLDLEAIEYWDEEDTDPEAIGYWDEEDTDPGTGGYGSIEALDPETRENRKREWARRQRRRRLWGRISLVLEIVICFAVGSWLAGMLHARAEERSRPSAVSVSPAASAYDEVFTWDPSLEGTFYTMTDALRSGGPVEFPSASERWCYVVMRKFQLYFLGNLEVSEAAWNGERVRMVPAAVIRGRTLAEQLAMHDAAAAAVREILLKCPARDPEGRIRFFHDYLCEHVTYDFEGIEAERAGTGWRGASAYDALVKGLAVCEGYTRAFYALCAAAGIPVRYVAGEPVQNHSWNEVYLDGAWKKIDVTNDDQGSWISYEHYLTDDVYAGNNGL